MMENTDAILMNVAIESGVSIQEVKEAEQRMFATIASNNTLPPYFRTKIERKFQETVKNDVQRMMEVFTNEENKMIAFVPLVISFIAWKYAKKVIDYCVVNHISEFRKLSGAIKNVHEAYMKDLELDLDSSHIAQIDTQTKDFMDKFSMDFTILWIQCNNIVIQHGDIRDPDMITDALCSIMMVEFLKQHIIRIDKLIEARMGKSRTMMNPAMLNLSRLMKQYFPQGFKAEISHEIEMAIQVFANKICKIELEVRN